MLTVLNLIKRFQNQTILRSVSFSVAPGSVFTIMGTSGGGKTTLLRCICRLEKIDSGLVMLDNVLVEKLPAGTIGLVPQGYHLFEHFNVLENVTYALRNVRGLSKEQANARASELLLQLNVQTKAKCYPSQLSGGQKQRVALARALAMKPQILLFDEPTSALDPEMTAEVAQLIRTLAAEGMIVIIATHDLNLAEVASDHMLLLDGGSVVETATTKDFFNSPQHLRTQAFLSSVRPTLKR